MEKDNTAMATSPAYLRAAPSTALLAAVCAPILPGALLLLAAAQRRKMLNVIQIACEAFYFHLCAVAHT